MPAVSESGGGSSAAADMVKQAGEEFAMKAAELAVANMEANHKLSEVQTWGNTGVRGAKIVGQG